MKARIKELLFSGLTLKSNAGSFLFFRSLISPVNSPQLAAEYVAGDYSGVNTNLFCFWIEPGISVDGIISVL